MVRHHNTECLHVTDFITVKNSVNFPLLGNPTDLLLRQILPKTTFEEDVVKDGVLIPGRVVNNIIDKIMKNIRNHHISVSENDRATTSQEPQTSSSMLNTEWMDPLLLSMKVKKNCKYSEQNKTWTWYNIR